MYAGSEVKPAPYNMAPGLPAPARTDELLAIVTEGSGKGTVIVFSWVSTAEATRLQWIAPSSWPHRWFCLNSVCPGTKQTDMHVGKGFARKRGGWRRGRREGKVVGEQSE